MNYETQLHEVIELELDKLREMEGGTETYKTTVDGVTKLVDRAIEMEKLENDVADKAKNRKEDRIDRIVKNIISVGNIVVPAGITVWGVIKSFEFEKEGTITTIMGRGLISKMIPKK